MTLKWAWFASVSWQPQHGSRAGLVAQLPLESEAWQVWSQVRTVRRELDVPVAARGSSACDTVFTG